MHLATLVELLTQDIETTPAERAAFERVLAEREPAEAKAGRAPPSRDGRRPAPGSRR